MERSDSDWEDLFAEDEEARRESASAPAAAAAYLSKTVSTIKPLCLCVNQKRTRVGVGHETGFLVFHVVADHAESYSDVVVEDRARHTKAEADAQCEQRRQAKRTNRHLALDPRYNTDPESFALLQRRVKEEVARRKGQQSAVGMNSPAPSTGSTAAPSEAQDAGSPKVGQKTSSAVAPPAASDKTEVGTPHEAKGEQASPVASPVLNENTVVDDSLDLLLSYGSMTPSQCHVFSESAESVAPSQRSRPQPRSHRDPYKRNAAAAAVTAVVPHTLPDEREGRTAPAAAAVSDSPQPSAPVTSSEQPAPTLLTWEDEGDEEEEEDGSSAVREKRPVGFAGGGVCVMALLYDQPCVAVVGGGPTPMGPPRRIHLLQGGVPLQRLEVADPVVRLFLDARLLFVCTARELRVYTNPLERDWTACGYVLSLSPSPLPNASLETPPSMLPSSPKLSVASTSFTGPSGNVHTAAAASTVVSQSLPSAGSTLANEPITVTPSATDVSRVPCVAHQQAIPPFPVDVQYVHSLLLLRSAASPCGFTLLSYSTRHVESDTLSARTSVAVKEVANVEHAHKNPLVSLALVVGATADVRRAVSGAAASRDGVWGGGEAGSRYSSVPSLPLTLVAACSAYATRITLWALLPATLPSSPVNDVREGSQSQLPPGSDEDRKATPTFVLLREYRVGIKVPTHRFLPSSWRADDAGLFHLQFLRNGRYLFCVRGGHMLVFSTAEEDADARKNVCDDHLQATVNRRSRLDSMKRMLPALEAYTRQHWSSCEAALPAHDPVFFPRWLYVFKQDQAAAAAAVTGKSPAVSSASLRAHSCGGTATRTGSVTGNEEVSSPVRVGEYRTANSGGGTGLVGKLTTYMSGYVMPSAFRWRGQGGGGATAAPTSTKGTLASSFGMAPSAVSMAASTSVHTSGGTTTSTSTSATERGKDDAAPSQRGMPAAATASAAAVPSVGVVYGEAFTQLAPCLLFWEEDEAALCAERVGDVTKEEEEEAVGLTFGVDRASLLAKKVMLNCVTCDGACLTVRLYTESGELRCAPAVPYAWH